MHDEHGDAVRAGKFADLGNAEMGGAMRVIRGACAGIGDQDDVAAAEQMPIDFLDAGLEPGDRILVKWTRKL